MVWYLCYGSNLCLERFLCYLTGEGSTRFGIKPDSNRKCKDSTPIQKTMRHDVKGYRMYFGNVSHTWQDKGVAFIKKGNPDDAIIGRAYLLTKQQYEHVREHEGTSFKWYGVEVDLGTIDGIPVKSFTQGCEPAYNAPCDAYRAVIEAGLIEVGLSKEEANNYLNACIRYKE